MIKHNKHKILSRFFSVVTVIVLLFSLALNVVAADTPALFSIGASSDDYYSASGFPFTFNCHSITPDEIIVHSTICPSAFVDDLDYNSSNQYFIEVLHPTSDYSSLEYSFFDFEHDPNLFVSVFPSGYFGCLFDFYFSSGLGVDYYTIEARDFYYYISPDYSTWNDSDHDSRIQLFLNLGNLNDFIFEDPTFEMYYSFGGEPDTAGNRHYYSGSATDVDDDVLFYPGDDFILSKLDEYSDGYLMYVEYACLTIPSYYNSIAFDDALYRSDFYNYRDFDLESYVEPVTPINPGVFADYTSWIGTAVGGFLGLEFVDGFTLGGILMVLIAFMITLWFLKVFAGG